MQNFIITLLICSATMSVIVLLHMASTPIISKFYSEKWRYYTWLVIVIGLIIPLRPQWDNAIVIVEMPTIIYSAPAERTAERLSNPLTMPYTVNSAYYGNTSDVSLWQIGFAVWLCGMLIFLAYHIIKHLRFMKMIKRWREEITDRQILSLYENIKSEMGITRHIPLYLCPFGSPMLIGFIKPQIFLPTNDLAQDELRFILRHELVHYRRRDLLYKYLLVTATAVHWFNPVIYLMARAINMLCEVSCDAEVVQSADIDTRQSYSEALIGVVKYQSKFKTALSTNFYGGKKGVKNRISSIMDIRRKKAGIVIACLAVVLTLGTGFVFDATHVIACGGEDLGLISNMPLYTIDCSNRNIQFTMGNHSYAMARGQTETITQTSSLSFEEAAVIAANAIYQEFDFCIDGMTGYMGLAAWSYPPVWIGAIISQELTNHSDGDELFLFSINAHTGNVLSITINTEESPFLG